MGVAAADDVDLERDRTLVLRAQDGDDTAFTELYVRYYNRLVRFALKRMGDPVEAEEIAQETFLRAYRALPRFGGERKLYPWLTVIASRLCIDAHRRRDRVEVGEVADTPVAEAGYEQLDDASELDKLHLAMDRLNPRHRDVLELRERHGWAYQAIADHYEVSIGTVEALLFRARKALRREYEGLGAAVMGLPFMRRFFFGRHGSAATSPAAFGAFSSMAVAGLVAFGASGAAAVPAGYAAIASAPRISAAGATMPAVAVASPVSSSVNPPGTAGGQTSGGHTITNPHSPAVAAPIDRDDASANSATQRKANTEPIQLHEGHVFVGVQDPRVIAADLGHDSGQVQ